MNPEQINAMAELAKQLSHQYFWWVICAICALFFKNGLENLVYGITFLLGNDYNVDDEVYIGGQRRAIIIKQTMFKTVFMITDCNRKLTVPNKELYGLRIEKVVPPVSNS